jgi:hypothetical protein
MSPVLKSFVDQEPLSKDILRATPLDVTEDAPQVKEKPVNYLETKSNLRKIKALANGYLDKADKLYPTRDLLLATSGELDSPIIYQLEITDQAGLKSFTDMPVVQSMHRKDNNAYVVAPDGSMFEVLYDPQTGDTLLSTVCEPLIGNLGMKLNGAQFPLFEGVLNRDTGTPMHILTKQGIARATYDGNAQITLTRMDLESDKLDLNTIITALTNGLNRFSPK